MISDRRRGLLASIEGSLTRTVKWSSTSSISVSYDSISITRNIIYPSTSSPEATVQCSASWITYTKSSGSINISQNTSTTTSRSGYVKLIPPEGYTVDGSDTINITQSYKPTYTLSYSSTSGGSISVSPNKSKYNIGDKVTITATPSSGYVFAGFSSNSSESSSTIGVNMNPSTTKEVIFSNSNITVRAVFRNFIYLMVECNMSSSILKDNTGYYLGELSSSSPNVRLYKSKTIGWNSTSSPSISDSILTVISNKSEPIATCNVRYDGELSSDTDYFTIYKLVNGVCLSPKTTKDQYWYIDHFDKSTKYVNFTTSPRIYLNENQSDSGGGTTTPSTTKRVKYGSKVSVTATPSSGYQFLKWDDGGSQNHTASVTNSSNTYLGEPSDMSIELWAYFKSTSTSVSTYTVYAYTDNSNMGSVSPSSKSVTKNGSCTFNISPKSGYKYSKIRWSGYVNGTASVDNNVLTISDVVGNCKVYVQWQEDSTSGGSSTPVYVSLSLGSPSGGSGSRGSYAFPSYISGGTVSKYGSSGFIANTVGIMSDITSSSYSYNYGTKVTLCAILDNKSYKFSKWSDGSTTAIRVITLTSNTSIYPIFVSNSSSSTCKIYVNGSNNSHNIYIGCPVYTNLPISYKPSSITAGSADYTGCLFMIGSSYKLPVYSSSGNSLYITTSQ